MKAWTIWNCVQNGTEWIFKWVHLMCKWKFLSSDSNKFTGSSLIVSNFFTTQWSKRNSSIERKGHTFPCLRWQQNCSPEGNNAGLPLVHMERIILGTFNDANKWFLITTRSKHSPQTVGRSHFLWFGVAWCTCALICLHMCGSSADRPRKCAANFLALTSRSCTLSTVDLACLQFTWYALIVRVRYRTANYYWSLVGNMVASHKSILFLMQAESQVSADCLDWVVQYACWKTLFDGLTCDSG